MNIFSTFNFVIAHRAILLFLFLSLSSLCFSQANGNVHSKTIKISSDTIQLDTLSLIPGSITIKKSDGTMIDTSLFRIDHANGKLILNRKKMNRENILLDSIQTEYKTFPHLFTQETKHKDIKNIRPDNKGFINPFAYTIDNKNDDIFKMDGLNKTGSISRGITIGSNQDMVVNSNLNLQLSGKLNNDIEILLAATDNNIPIQPDGNTQQLQEFDKVFIQLSKNKTKLIAGDFQMTRPKSYFMNFYKKAITEYIK